MIILPSSARKSGGGRGGVHDSGAFLVERMRERPMAPIDARAPVVRRILVGIAIVAVVFVFVVTHAATRR